MELNPNTYNPQIHQPPQQWRRQTPPQLTMRTFAPLGPTGPSLVPLHSLPLDPQTSSYTLQDNETFGFNVLPPVEESPRTDPTLPQPIVFYDTLSDGSDHTRVSPSLSPMQPPYSGRASPSLSPLPSLPSGPFPMLGHNASGYSGRISPSYSPMPVMIDTPSGPTFLYPMPSPYQPGPSMGPMFPVYQPNPPPSDPNHSPPIIPQLVREPEGYDSENLFLDDKQDMVYCRFLDVSLRLLEDIERQAHREGCKWSRQTRVAVKNLKSDLKSNYFHWAQQNNFELINCYIEIAHEMAILIEHDTKGKKRIGELVQKFQNMLEYMKRDNFDIYEAGLDIEGFEQRRAILLHVRLFKSLQLMRFKEFNVTLSTENNCAERNLRGKTVIRNRCKRMDSFRPEAHQADMFVRDYILTGESGIVDMYICKDHKPQTLKNKNKPRVVGGLLYYYVCESEDAAERFLRELMKHCESGDQAKVAIKQKMFRKHRSTKGDFEEDRRVRNMLCSKQHWSREDFEMQKAMYHFTLAIPEEFKRQDIPYPQARSRRNSFEVTTAYPQTRSRRNSFEVSPRAVAH